MYRGRNIWTCNLFRNKYKLEETLALNTFRLVVKNLILDQLIFSSNLGKQKLADIFCIFSWFMPVLKFMRRKREFLMFVFALFEKTKISPAYTGVYAGSNQSCPKMH